MQFCFSFDALNVSSLTPRNQ